MTAQAPLHQTRAAAIGCKPKVLAARSKRQIVHIRERIDRLALPYEDIDDGFRLAVDELRAHFDEVAARIDEITEWLYETVDY